MSTLTPDELLKLAEWVKDKAYVDVETTQAYAHFVTAANPQAISRLCRAYNLLRIGIDGIHNEYADALGAGCDSPGAWESVTEHLGEATTEADKILRGEE